MIKPNQIYHGDCLEIMRDIDTRSVDLVLCDLPYGTTQCKWDSVIPLPQLWGEYRRIIKWSGVIVLFAAQPFTSALVMSNLRWFRYDWVWRKNIGTGHLNAKRQPLRDKEDILVFSPKETAFYNPQMGVGAPFKGGGGGITKKRVYGHHGAFRNDNDGTRYPKQVLEFPYVRCSGVRHPTQKPAALCRYLVKTYSRPDALVLDNCCGAGTVPLACYQTSRKYIGIELDPYWAKIARRRLLLCP